MGEPEFLHVSANCRKCGKNPKTMEEAEVPNYVCDVCTRTMDLFDNNPAAAGHDDGKPVCPNCGQWQDERSGDCFNQCAKRGFADRARTPGEILRDDGKAKIRGKNAEWVEKMRDLARVIIGSQGYVTTDDLHELAGDEKPTHPNAWGSIFAGDEFETCGTVLTKRAVGRARRIYKWRRKEEAHAEG